MNFSSHQFVRGHTKGGGGGGGGALGAINFISF